MNLKFVDAIVKALEPHDASFKDEIFTLRHLEHAPTRDNPVDLLSSYYRQQNYFQFFSISKSIDYQYTNRYFVQCREPVSRFFFVAGSTSSPRLELSVRSGSHMDSNRKFSLQLNGHLIFSNIILDDWQSFSIQIPGNCLTASGIQQIRVEWPQGTFFTPHIPIAEPKETMERLQVFWDCCRPVYGELMSMYVYEQSGENREKVSKKYMAPSPTGKTLISQ